MIASITFESKFKVKYTYKSGHFASNVNSFIFTKGVHVWHNNCLWCADDKKGFEVKIRNRYNQAPHLTRDNIWESNKNTRKHHTLESQEVNPFSTGDHKTVRNRQDSMTKANMKHILQKKIHKRRTALEQSVKFIEGLKHV